MKAIFVDTAGWMACADGADPAHLRAAAARDTALEAGRTPVTTDFVADETLTLIRVRLGLAAADAWWQQVDASSRVRWERVDSDRFERARVLFFQYRDKQFSFTDCTSVVVMRELRVTHALTTDRHLQLAAVPPKSFGRGGSSRAARLPLSVLCCVDCSSIEDWKSNIFN